jgi:cytochrome c-type biogenesis protein CcmH/NrfG
MILMKKKHRFRRSVQAASPDFSDWMLLGRVWRVTMPCSTAVLFYGIDRAHFI